MSAISKINPDCLIFDVDGVLLSSNETYQEIIRLTVEGEWRKLGFVTDAPGYSAGLNAVFKNHGCFNDDYDIAWTLLNIALSRNAERLSDALPSPEFLREIISGCAGSPEDWLPGHFEPRVALKDIHELGQNAFTGKDGTGGMWKLDRPSLYAHWRDLPLPVYVYTGRNLTEWNFAKETLGWRDFPDDRIIHSGAGIKKPSPAGLEIICSRFGHERPLFFGDTMSDKLAHSAFGRGWFAAIGDMPSGGELTFPDVTAALSRILNWP